MKYLAGHAEARARDPSVAELAACGPWDHAIVVPARRERAEDCLAVTAAVAGSSLTVLVVNAADDPDDRAAGEALIDELSAGSGRWRGPGMFLVEGEGAARALLVVDACRGPWRFGARDGVGRARKLGADLVVALSERGAIRDGWIHTSDADARLPPEHCARVAALDGCAGAVAPFWHVASGEVALDRATAAYELSLRYYVAGLAHAGSPFAFHTIGSTISAACWAYAAARGFPLREAGEDFYLLAKLAKLGPIASVAGAPVEIRSRRSLRVPFGTGPAVEALLARGDSTLEREVEVYDPRVFEVVAAVEATLAQLAAGAAFTGFGELEALAPAQLGRLAAAIETVRARYPPAQLRARLREHFDAFRTLKLIHELCPGRWPRVPWSVAVREAPFVDVSPELGLDAQRRWLAARERPC